MRLDVNAQWSTRIYRSTIVHREVVEAAYAGTRGYDMAIATTLSGSTLGRSQLLLPFAAARALEPAASRRPLRCRRISDARAETLRSGNLWKWFLRNKEIPKAITLAGM
jgi:hypothetical protein